MIHGSLMYQLDHGRLIQSVSTRLVHEFILSEKDLCIFLINFILTSA